MTAGLCLQCDGFERNVLRRRNKQPAHHVLEPRCKEKLTDESAASPRLGRSFAVPVHRYETIRYTFQECVRYIYMSK